VGTHRISYPQLFSAGLALIFSSLDGFDEERGEELAVPLITIYAGRKKVNKNGSTVISSSSSFFRFCHSPRESNGRVNFLRQTAGVTIDPALHYIDQEKVLRHLGKKIAEIINRC